MGAYMIAKENLSMDVLIIKGPMKVIKYPNLFTHLESNFTKELIKGGKHQMTYDVLGIITNQTTTNIVIEIENDELWKFGFKFIWVLNKMHMLIKHFQTWQK